MPKFFCSLTSDNSELWVENSFVGKRWTLADRHVITGVPVNDWELHVPSGVCIDVVPVGDEGWVARPYGFNDYFQRNTANESTLFMGRAIVEWSAERGINLPACATYRMRLIPCLPEYGRVGGCVTLDGI